MTIFPKWLLNTDKIPNPKGPFPKMLKNPWQRFYGWLAILRPFQQYFSHRLCEGNNDGTLFTVGKISPPPTPHRGGIKPGMDNLPFHSLSNSISIFDHIPPPPPPPTPGGTKPGMDNLPFHVLSNGISIISGRWGDDDERLCEVEHRLW